MAFHTPHGSARFRLPWSWSSFDYRTLCEELWAQCATRGSRSPRSERRGGDGRPRPIAAQLAAPLIVDALGWRRVLGAGRERAAARRAHLARPGGPSRTRAAATPTSTSGSTARSIRSGYAWSVPAGDEQRVGVGSYEPRDHVKEPTRDDRRPARRGAGALPGQLVPARAAARGRGRRVLRRRQRRALLPAVGRGDPDGVLLRDRVRARAAAACSAASATRAEALRRYGAFSASHARAFAIALRLQRLVPALPPRVLTALLAVLGRERLCRRAFAWYLEQAHPRFAEASARGGSRRSRASSGSAPVSRCRPCDVSCGIEERGVRRSCLAQRRTSATGRLAVGRALAAVNLTLSDECGLAPRAVAHRHVTRHARTPRLVRRPALDALPSSENRARARDPLAAASTAPPSNRLRS